MLRHCGFAGVVAVTQTVVTNPFGVATSGQIPSGIVIQPSSLPPTAILQPEVHVQHRHNAPLQRD